MSSDMEATTARELGAVGGDEGSTDETVASGLTADKAEELYTGEAHRRATGAMPLAAAELHVGWPEAE